MLKCRCNEMERCNRDIGRLVHAVARCIDIGKKKEVVNVDSQTINGYSVESLTSDIQMEMSCAVKGVDKELGTNTDRVIFTITSYENSLRNAYSALQKEDAAYHEELLRLQQEAGQE
ncbi:MAG: hypothetical protein IJ405_02545 [Lachnospiraceae bacterium]|nr:hypothetical protein [Lachnospiraceae bacterium]